jgi:predicted AAA+ superfamily ATPase
MENVRKPELMHSLFLLGTHHFAQELSDNTVSGQLGDVGAVSTVARYLGLFDDARLLCGLNRLAQAKPRARAHQLDFSCMIPPS